MRDIRALALLGVTWLTACSIPSHRFTPGETDSHPPDAGIDAPTPAVVTVQVMGNGGGTITSAPAGVSCPDACTLSVPPGTTLELTANAAPGSTFLGWGGDACSGTGTCSFTASADTTVIAAFGANNSLVVMPAGNGTGTVTSNPPGISCGTDCSEVYAPGTVVTLTAAPTANSTFTGWSGTGISCPGTGTCQVTLSDAVMVKATFTLKKFALTISRPGNGAGTVTSNPSGISCPSACTANFDAGTIVTLTQAAGAASKFTSWSSCTGAGPCQVTMTAATTVAATFTLGTIFVTNFPNDPGSIAAFPANANGDAASLVIGGTSTTLITPVGITVANNQIIVADQAANAIDIFPVTGSGDIPTTRRIFGPTTMLNRPAGVVVSANELYVSQEPGVILVFPVGANGDVRPTRSITGLGRFILLAISNTEIFASEADGGRIFVFPTSTSGAAVPTRTISGPTTGLINPMGLLVQNGEIFVVDQVDNSIRVFSQTANGDVAPLRVIKGNNTQLTRPQMVTLFSGELYVANFSVTSVVVFPANASGDVVPSRRIVGPSTHLSGATGVLVF